MQAEQHNKTPPIAGFGFGTPDSQPGHRVGAVTSIPLPRRQFESPATAPEA